MRSVLTDDGKSDAGVEVQGIVVDAVICREAVSSGAGEIPRPAAELIRHYELSVGELSDGSHARAIGVGGVSYVVDGGFPGEQIRRDLVDEFLAVERVALVGIVDDELTVVHHEKRFPDGGQTVVRYGFATTRNVRDKLPGVAFVETGVQVDLGD